MDVINYLVISVHTVKVHFFYIIGVAVTIGLEQATYSVGEADGSQKVCVVVKNGKPDSEIFVSFRTEDSTAVGRCSYSYTHCYITISREFKNEDLWNSISKLSPRVGS